MIVASAVNLARAQFATTSLYHFMFVPLTLGLGPIVATFQTLWHRTGNETWLRLTRFFGTLFLINFAIGVATGLVQEFEFGMNWSVYSKYVGNVFGAPLAIEGLAAFMLESTFLALVGGLIGCLVALPTNGISSSAGGANFAEVAFAFRIAPAALMIGIVFAIVMGIVGGMLPAVKASRLPITTALREA